ncbi:MAG TPA: AAA family ATPase [Anaerolineae bacterium]|nr:AAA family ATPase [Anaerolineae bacterium]
MSGRSDSRSRYEALLYGEGALKVVFKAVKAAGEGAGLDRAFITGVSPVVLSDITSGYNIAEHISLEPSLHDLCGFREGEVAEALAQVADECGFPPEKADEALATMRTFYNGYAFRYDSREMVYNPTLALYFMKHFQQHCQAPPNMLDSNFAMDRQKLAYVARLPGGQSLILNALQEDPPVAIFQLSDRFGLAEMLKTSHDTSFMASLLYYLGVLTLNGRTDFGEVCLRIPNLVVRKLYAEQLRDLLLPDGSVLDTIREAARALYQAGDLQAVCDFVEQRYFRVLSNRDYRWASEMTLKTAFLTLLFNDEFYIVDSEAALERGYADLVLIVRPEMRRYQLLDILIEFKYVGLQEAGLSGEEARAMGREAIHALPVVQQKFQEAAAQLWRYRRRLESRYGGDRLRTYAVVALGFERLVWELT